MHADAPDLGKHQHAIIQSGAVAVLLEGEAVEAVAPLETWESSLLAALHPSEEGLIGLVEPGEHVLEGVGVNGRVCGELGADSLQFRFLLVARDGDVAPLPSRDALLHSGVVEIAAAPEDCIQRALLGGRGPQLLFVRLAHRLHVTVSPRPAHGAILQQQAVRAPVPCARRGARRSSAPPARGASKCGSSDAPVVYSGRYYKTLM